MGSFPCSLRLGGPLEMPVTVVDSEKRRNSEKRRTSEKRRNSEKRRATEKWRISEKRRFSEKRRMSQRASGARIASVGYQPGLRQRPRRATAQCDGAAV